MKLVSKASACAAALGLAAFSTIPAHAATNVGDGAIDPDLTQVNLLNTNDFHGHFTKDFACTVTTAQREQPGVTFLSAGDNIGGTPFESASQNDEPSIDYLNALGLKVSAVGNHEFDKGLGDLTGRVRDRAEWTYVGANVYKSGTTTPALPEYEIVEQNGVKVGVIGAVTREVPSLVAADGIKGLEFGDPVAAVNRVATKLTDGDAANGEADVLVAEYHEGAPEGESDLASQMAASTTFEKIVKDTSPKVAAIFTGHTHQKYAWDGPAASGTRPVIQTDYYASHLGMLTLGYDPDSGEVTQYKMTNREVTEPTAACEADPTYRGAAKIVDDANARAETIGKQKVGTKTAPITTAFNQDGSRDNRSRESTLSNMIAQSYVDSINKPGRTGGVDIGVMNPGGVRADLDAAGETITYAEAASIMPFSNTVQTVDLTGEQFVKVLEQQWQPASSSRPFLKLGLSDNVTYTYDPTAAEGERINTVMVDGKQIDPAATYTIASNSFLLAGGDNFTEFANGTNSRDSGLIDQSLFVEWIKENSPLTPSFKKHSVAVEDQPTTVTAGEEVTLKTSGWDMTNRDPQWQDNTELSVTSAGHPLESAFGIRDERTQTPPYPQREGVATLSVSVLPDAPTGPNMITVRAIETGTTAYIPVNVVAGGTSTPTETSTAAPSETASGTSTASGPRVETGQLRDGSNSHVLLGAGVVALLLGGSYLLVRARLG